MAEAARVRQDTGELDASVSAMIDRAESVRDDGGDECRNESLDLMPEASVPEEAPSPPPAQGYPPTPHDDELLKSVQRLLKEVPAAPGGARPAEASGPTETPGPETPELELPADFVAPVSETPGEPAAPVAQDAARIETLDQELAGLADELISTELAADPAPDDPAETLSAAVEAAAAPGAEPAAATEPVPELADAPPEPQTKPQTKPQTEPQTRPNPRRFTLEPVLRPLLAACAALSAPLRNKPQHVRDIVGWNALWLAFLGGCVWAYVLFIRSPEPPVPSLLPTRAASAESGGNGHAPAKKDSHAKGGASKSGAKKGSHAKAEPKKSGGHH